MKVGWEEVDSSERSQSQSGGLFFTPQVGKKNVIRLVGKPHRFMRHWNFNKEVCLKESPNDDTYCPMCEVDDRAPSLRYIIFVLDKGDLDENNVPKLKLYEAGPSVFKHFKTYMEMREVDPGGKDGPDFVIRKNVDNPGNPLSTTYDVLALDKAPFSEAEIKLIKEKIKEIDITKFYRRKSVEELQEIVSTVMAEDGIEHNATPSSAAPQSNNSDDDDADLGMQLDGIADDTDDDVDDDSTIVDLVSDFIGDDDDDDDLEGLNF